MTQSILRSTLAMIMLVLFTASAWAAAPTISSTSPSNNAMNISATSDITINFNQTMNTATLTTSTIKVYGSFKGYYSGVVTTSSTSATFNPDSAFKSGEVITVIVTTGVQNPGAEAMANGYVTRFTADAQAGGNSLGSKVHYAVGDGPYKVISADVDNDGDNDLIAANYANTVSVLINNGSGTFATAVNYSRGGSNWNGCVTAADVNNDGDVDLIAINNNYVGNLAVLQNIGDGTFATAVTYTMGPGSTSVPDKITTGDVDGDGDIDLVGVVGVYDSLFVVKNNGSGVFSNSQRMRIGDQPTDVILADLDRDGDLDVVAVNMTANTLSVLHNNGSGTMTLNNSPSVGSSPRQVAAVDVDGDGNLDLVVTNSNSSTLSVLDNAANNGTSFTSASTPSIGTSSFPIGVTAMDIDTDGDQDLIVTTLNNVGVLMNNGSGSFASVVKYSTGSSPYSVAAADLNGDGGLDVITANNFADSVSVLMNVLSQTVTTSAETNLASTSVTLNGVVNANGTTTTVKFVYKENTAGSFLDTVTATPSTVTGNSNTAVSYNLTGLVQNRAYNYKAIGISSLGTVEGAIENFQTTAIPFAVASTSPTRNALDIAKDANITITFSIDPDQASISDNSNLIVTGSLSGRHSFTKSYNAGTYTLTVNPDNDFLPGEVVTFKIMSSIPNAEYTQTLGVSKMYSYTVATAGTGEGYFSTSNQFTHSLNSNTSQIYPVDFDKDGDVDIVSFRSTDYVDLTRKNNSVETYTNQTAYQFAGFNLRSLAFSDVNRDQYIDVAVFGASGSTTAVSVIVNSSGTLSPPLSTIHTSSTFTNTNNQGGLFADVNMDGYDDFIVRNSGIYGVLPFYSSSGTSFSQGSTFQTTTTGDLLSADLNNDGYPDFVGVSGPSNSADQDTIGVLLSTASNTYAAVTKYRTETGAQILSAANGDVDGDGDMDIVVGSNSYSNNLTVFYNNGSGNFSTKTTSSLPDRATGLTAADMDGDGDLDLVYYSSTYVYVSYNNGSGVFNSHGSYSLGSGMTVFTDLAVFDADDDGDLDAVLNDPNNSSVIVYKNSTVTAPTSAGGAPIFNYNYGDSITITFANGNGANRLVVLKQGSAVNATPSDNTTYTANSDFGSGSDLGGGNFVVYNGNASSYAHIPVANLSYGTAYYIAIFEYNGPSGKEKYLTTGYQTGSGTTNSTPNSATVNAFTRNFGTSVQANWSNGGGLGRIVVMKQGGAVSATPTNNTSYTANAAFGSGDDLGSGNFVIYKGIGTSVNVTGLSVGTSYHIAVFEYFGSAGSEVYGTPNDPNGLGNITTNATNGIPFDTVAGKALAFDGGNNYGYADIGYGTLSNGFTMEMWVKPNAIGSQMVMLADNNDEFFIGINSSGNFFTKMYDTDSESDVTATGTSTAVAGTWYHITVTGVGGGNLVLYVNGTQEASSAITSFSTDRGPRMWLGTDYYENYYYNGTIDEVRLWSAVRSVTDIRSTMYKTLSGNPSNLTFYLQFNEKDGNGNYFDLINNILVGNYDNYAQWVTSTAPVGGATVASTTSFQSGTTTVGNATLTMADAFDNPVDIFVSELTAEPSNYPSGFGSSIGGKYFVINLFGNPGTFSTSITLNFGPGVVTSEQQSDPGLLQLFKRESNSSGSWTMVAFATSANSTTGEVTWNGITSFSQFLAVSSEDELPPTITITKADGADWTLEENQDRITNNVWLTRADYYPMFNIATEGSYGDGSPQGTEWAHGKVSDGVETLTFSDFRSLRDDLGGSLQNLGGHDVVLHLIEKNVYLDVHFNSWSDYDAGAGFSYTRSLLPLMIVPGTISNLTKHTATVNAQVYSKNGTATAYVLYGTTSGTYTDSIQASPASIQADTIYSIAVPRSGLTENVTYYYRISLTQGSTYERTEEMSFVPHDIQYWNKDNGTITFTKDDNEDWTQPGNQDRISNAVWLTRASTRGIFNINSESSYDNNNDTSPAGTEWAYGTINAGVENLTFASWYDTHNGTPPDMVNQDMVLHLIDEDIYVDIKFLSWTQSGGGGFSYTRGTSPLMGVMSHASSVTSTTATVHGSVFSKGYSATAKFLYGTVSGTYTDSIVTTPSSISANTLTDVSADLTSLVPGTMYYVRLASQNDTIYLRSSEKTFMLMSPLAGNALQFDGSNDYVTVGSESDFDFANAVTLEAWIKPSTTSGEYGIVNKNTADGMHPYLLRVENGEITFGFYDGTWYPVTTSGANIPVGEWTHVAGTYDKTTAKIYINGVLTASENYTFNIPQNNNPIEIGRTNNSYFNGSIEEVRVWNVARTQQQIQDNMRFPFTSTQSGLVGYFQLNASSGTSAQNHGSGSSGSLSNFDFNSSSGWVSSSAMIGPLAGAVTGISNVGATSATFDGDVFTSGSNASVKFLYGTVSGTYTDSISATPGTINQDVITAVSATSSTLSPGTLYYVTVALTNSNFYQRCGESSFMTMSSSPGHALHFDGSNDYVNIPDNNALDLTSTYTLEAWIKPEGFTSMAGIISKYHSGGANGYFIRLSNGAPYTGIRFDEFESASGILSAGNWYHIAAVNNAGTRTLYVNGDSVGITGEGYTTNSNSDHVAIGSDFNGRYFNGVIDEVRIWNVARTQQQVQDNMNTPFTSAQSGLVGYWQLNASSGSVAHGHGTDAGNGTLYNFNFDANSGWLESAAPLPVELASFTAESKQLNTELKWSTATELNNYGFEIERSVVVDAPKAKSKEKEVANVRSWSKIFFVEGSGTSNAPKEYAFTDRVGKTGKFVYRLKIVDRDGSFTYSPEVEVSVGSVPKVFALEQNYPNPFNPSTMIDFTLEHTGLTTLKIYDIVGREVATLVNNELLEAGVYHQKQFDARNLASGVYFARLVSGSKVQVKKLMLMK